MKPLIGLLLACACFGQTNSIVQAKDNSQIPRYQARKTTTNSAEKITIQASSTSSPVQGESLWVSTSVACNVSFSMNGAAATTTALAVTGPLVNLSDAQGVIVPSAFSASNVGAGTAIGGVTPLTAGATQRFDISAWYLGRGVGSSKNYSVATDCTTGTVDIVIQWRASIQ